MAVLVVACGGDSNTGPGSSIIGTYVLTTVNGAPLPYALLSLGDYEFDVLSDQLTFHSDGSVTEIDVNRNNEFGTFFTDTSTGVGFYVARADSVVVTWNGGTYGYARTGNGLTVHEPVFGGNWVYTRQ